jgi:uncharacterized flavoprotein (TIGR03862 family)
MAPHPTIAVIGGGPAGLIAAEILGSAGQAVTVYDQMPSVGRKLLMAGRSGLNLTYTEPLASFLDKYGAARDRLAPIITAFPPAALIDWCHSLGQPTFVGSTNRVFPAAMKASPLLRAWLRRLDALGVTFHTRHRWDGWDSQGALRFVTPTGVSTAHPAAIILALGGATWPRLGSDGAWTHALRNIVPDIAPFQPANCGFRVDWSAHLRARFAGQPLKRIALHFGPHRATGECMISEAGLEGGAIYALSSVLRDAIAAEGPVTLSVDLRPDLTRDALDLRLGRIGRGQSTASVLRKGAGLLPPAAALLQEALHAGASRGAIRGGDLGALIKALPVRLEAPMDLERAISSAGGVSWDDVGDQLMLLARPGVFVAGEMLDWEAPTGGYLLQACFSTGVAAASGALSWLGCPGAGAGAVAESL